MSLRYRAHVLVLVAATALACLVGGPATASGSAPSGASAREAATARPTVTGVSPASGPGTGGNTVTITGTGFVDVDEVFFTNVDDARDFVVNSDTSITATVPPSQEARTVHVTVTTHDYTRVSQATPHDKYTYVGPSVRRISPSSGPVVGGNTIEITGTGFLGASSVYFDGPDSTADFVVNSDTSITATVPPGHYSSSSYVYVYGEDDSIHSVVTPRSQYVYLSPRVTAVSPASGPLAGGSTVVVRGRAFVGVSHVSFRNANGLESFADFTVNSGRSITVTVPAGEEPGTANVLVFVDEDRIGSPPTRKSRYTYLPS